ncbi:MAG: acylating sulfoacetaldehyde dehydrogenase [Betaproteobacteria bacterium]|jgi:sulfoacetaldehyde dehydrogenase|nr:aldehyde dehydrogenase family protein [Betaproteobacteria bacterium]
MPDTRSPAPASPAAQTVAELLRRARAAQAVAARYSQAQLDELATAAGWAIMEPSRNRRLAELAVRDTGLGSIEDKINKNHRKTLGLMRDLQGAISTGVLREIPELGLTEIARPVGVVAAVVPSTNPGATPANNIINAVKCGNAAILSPSPKGFSTSALLLEFIHAEFERIGAPKDLVQTLPNPVTKELSQELMKQCDLVVVTGSQANVRAGYSSGTPALGVGAGNVAVIVDDSADLDDAAQKIMRSKIFDHATSCSSENSVIIHAAVYDAMLAALARQGGVLLDAGEKATLQAAMFPGGKLSPAVTAQPVARICAVAGLNRPAAVAAKCLMVEESGFGRDAPFSGEKLSPVMALYKARDFDHAFDILQSIYAWQGNGHSCGIHTRNDAHIRRLGLEMTVCRVIVNQAHAIANGGNFDNGLPFSLTMGCGTWGRNSFSENLNYRHFMNTTRIVRTIPPREPSVDEIFGSYRKKYGA